MGGGGDDCRKKGVRDCETQATKTDEKCACDMTSCLSVSGVKLLSNRKLRSEDSRFYDTKDSKAATV